MEFYDIDFTDELLDGIEAMGFKNMTPIQEQAIPAILEGRDLIGSAQTGTGKTAAFMLPVLDLLNRSNSNGKVRVLVVVPTRELAMQIDQQIQGFAYFLPVSSISVYGGNNSEGWDAQRRALETGADVIVATPGRLLSHYNLQYVDFSNVEHLILDEADRMLDMGFFEDIMKIAGFLPEKRQTLMFSATMPPKIREMAKKLLKNPLEISISVSKTAEGVRQTAFVVYENQKIPLLVSLLKAGNYDSAIVFSSTKSKVKEVFKHLKAKGFDAGEIHSDLDQDQREEVMRDFRNKKVKILVATDIVSRGIDVDNIELVLNYDVPHEAEDYVHRVGRTARAARQGEAVTFIGEAEMDRFGRIEQLIKMDIEKPSLPDALGSGPEYMPFKKRSGGSPKGKKPMQHKGDRSRKIPQAPQVHQKHLEHKDPAILEQRTKLTIQKRRIDDVKPS